MASEYTSDAFVLDQSKLGSDQAEIHVLHYLSKVEKALEYLSSEDIRPTQPTLESTLLSLLVPTPSVPAPKPGRPIRQLLARCLVLLHTKAESRSLFDLMREILRVAGLEGTERKGSEVAKENKVACWYVAGEVMKALGANNMSFMSDICLSATRHLRSPAFPALLRYHSLLALQKSLIKAGKAVSEQTGKDLIKHLKNGLSDKAFSIQRICAETLQTLSQRTTYISTLVDIESILSVTAKSLDSSSSSPSQPANNVDHQTRRAFSKLLAHLLSSTQLEGSAPPPPEPKKKPIKGPDEADNDEGKLPPPASLDAAPKTLLSPTEMLRQLSNAYNKPSTSRATKNALIDVYSTLFASLGSAYVEANYATIVQHLLGNDLLTFFRNTTSKHDILLLRKSISILLRDLIGVRLLSEQGQIAAIRELAGSYLRKWPSLMPNQGPAPGAIVLVPVLNEVAGLLEQLGNAPPPVQETLSDPLLRLLAHPDHAVRVAAAWCLRCFCHTAPLRLSKTIVTVLGELTKDVGMLGTPVAPADLSSRMLGRAQALSALLAVIPERPLYVSYDLSANVLDLAISVLKRSGEHEVKVATVEVQVAWTLIGSLMTLGPSFVKLHLPQLLVLWRNALPKPTSKDSSVGARSEAEWKFLLDVREATLSSILSFLRHNLGQLVNLDVARRLVALLSNTLTFINSFTSQYADVLREQSLPSGSSSGPHASTSQPLTLSEREAMLRRRIYQCFTILGSSSASESLHSSLLASTVATFADPDNYSGSAAQAAIAASAGAFAAVWTSGDGYAFGVTSLVSGKEMPSEGEGGGGGGEGSKAGEKNVLNRDGIEVAIQSLLTTPILGSIDYDPLELCSVTSTTSSPSTSTISIEESLPSPSPSATGVIDAAIDLFAAIFPSQDPDSQARLLAQINSHARSPKLERNLGRKMAVLANSVEAIRRSLRVVMGSGGSRKARDSIGAAQVANPMKELLQDATLDSDLTLRTIGSESIGRLASLSTTTFMNTQIQWLIDSIVNNRNPESRAGCALSFGTIYAHVGSLIGGPLLKTMVNVLFSLANDPHPVVHFWSMQGLARVISSASLSYEPFVQSTLGQLANIYGLDTHEPEGGSVGSVNIRGDLPAYQVVCQILSAMVGVVGPELQEAGAVRSLIFLLVNEFSLEEDDGISVEAIKCSQQFLMFAPSSVDVPKLVSSFRLHLVSPRRPLKVAAINALYQLVQRDAPLMSKLGGNQLVEDLFGLLDDDPSIDGVRDVISNWAKQTSAASPSGWIDLCQRIMNRTTASQQVTSTSTTSKFQDDEAEGIVTSAEVAKAAGLRTTSRWRTQLFALRCLHEVILAVVAAGHPEQLNPVLAREMQLNPRATLVSRVGDLIRMAFSASTAQVTEIRLQGLIVLRDVIQHFSASPDPDFEGSLLLEQHQAPIAAALTPAFAADSTPEVLASAVQICAVFVSSGVVKEVGRMGRILKLLTNALEQCSDVDMSSLGDVSDLSTNASIMLKISIVSAWAELQSSSVRQTYLKAVLEPHRPKLAPFWVTSLRDLARIRTDPDAGPGSSASGDFMSSGLGREVLLPYYERSWAPILQAVATMMEENDRDILYAMDGIDPPSTSSTSASTPQLPERTDPTQYFYVVYGLAFEALATFAGDAYSSADSKASVPIIALTAMKSLAESRFSGSALLEGPMFDELCTLFYRLAMTAPPATVAHMVLVLTTLAKSQGATLSKATASDGSSEPSQLSRCLAIVAYVLRQAIPSALSPSRFSSAPPTSQTTLLKTSLVAYMEIVAIFPPSRQEDLYAVSLYLCSELLKDESSRFDLAGPTLALIKLLCDRAYAGRQPTGQVFQRVMNGLLSACIGHVEEMRGRSGPSAVTKVKNNLLTLTLLLTTLPADIKISRAVIERTCDLIGQKLNDSDDISLTAVQCAKTLILTSTRGNPTMQHCVGQIVPSLVAFVGKIVEVADEPEKLESRMGAVENVVQAFVGFVAGLTEEEQKSRAFAVLLPTFILLLSPSSQSQPPSSVHSLVAAQLLALAAQSPGAFRDATATLSPEARSILETSIRQSIEGREKKAAAGAAAAERKVQPQIALRSFG